MYVRGSLASCWAASQRKSWRASENPLRWYYPIHRIQWLSWEMSVTQLCSLCSQWSRQWSTNTKLSLFLERGKMHPPDFSEQMYLASHFSQLLETSEMQKETHLRRERQAKTMELTQYGSGKILFRLELVKARSLREAVVLTARQYHKVDLGRRVQSLGFLRRHLFFL